MTKWTVYVTLGDSKKKHFAGCFDYRSSAAFTVGSLIRSGYSVTTAIITQVNE